MKDKTTPELLKENNSLLGIIVFILLIFLTGGLILIPFVILLPVALLLIAIKVMWKATKDPSKYQIAWHNYKIDQQARPWYRRYVIMEMVKLFMEV